MKIVKDDLTSAEIILGNCLDEMEKIDSSSVDLVVTSPPYNIGLKPRNDYVRGYFDALPEQEYRESIGTVLAELARVVKPTGSIWFNMKSRWMDASGKVTSAAKGSLEPPWWVLNYTRGALFLKNLVIWNYDIGSDTRNDKFHPRHEFFFWFVKDPARYRFYVDRVRVPNKTGDPRCNPNGANPTDVWYFPLVKGNSNERNEHPAQFPESLVERIILSCSDEGDTVLDPFLGSGTTVAVAVKNRRRGVGIEIDEAYIANAKERIKKELAKPVHLTL